VELQFSLFSLVEFCACLCTEQKMAQVFRHSRKFCPEAIMFLRTSLLATTESKHISEEDSQVYISIDHL